MSAFRVSCLRSLVHRRTIPFRTIGAQRSFESCRRLAVGKESALHDENRAEKAEAHKQEQLKDVREGKGQWKDELASDSESIVKADRGDLKSSKESISKMQQETAKMAEEEKKGS